MQLSSDFNFIHTDYHSKPISLYFIIIWKALRYCKSRQCFANEKDRLDAHRISKNCVKGKTIRAYLFVKFHTQRTFCKLGDLCLGLFLRRVIVFLCESSLFPFQTKKIIGPFSQRMRCMVQTEIDFAKNIVHQIY